MTESRPNILLITTDQQRWDALALNAPGTDLRTPICDQLAAGGVNFTRAYSTCPVCIPARRTLLTGLHPSTHGLVGYQDGLEWNPPFTLPGLLARAGWQTALIGKLHLFPQRKRYGFETMIRTESPNDRWDSPIQTVNDWADALKAEGISHPNNLGINGNGRVARPWDQEERLHHTSWLADRAVDFLVKYRDPSCPYFLHLSFWAPHPPLIPPAAYWDRYHGKHQRKPIMGQWAPKFAQQPGGIADDSSIGPFDPREMDDAIAGYYGLINHIDDRIRFVLTRMFEYGSPRAKEPTLIIFTSDHGEMLGDHHLWRKSLPYEGSAHIPMFMAWRNMPGLRQGWSDELVGLEDVAATVLEACGQPIPDALAGEIESTSLLPILRGERPKVRERLFGECTGVGSHHYVIEGRYKYAWFTKTNEEQLFDLQEDPCEERDISGQTALLEPMRDHMAAHLAERKDRHYDRGALRPCANQPPRIFWENRFTEHRL
ncbi:MAG: sulfatase-like hydrolase/transferase [Phycisphaeraceae bacterium]|nr:sulfatase-like hydrolase/transferase [Phycisphaeraceae bacterium]